MSTFRKSIIPAERGYFAIDFERAGEKVSFHCYPVLAWLIEVGYWKTTVDPICICDLSNLSEGAILAPSERVYIRHGSYEKKWFETLDEYLIDVTDRHGDSWKNFVEIRECAKQWEAFENVNRCK